jgi:septum formation protein
MMKRQIILASTSPRRLELLRLLRIKFKAVDSGYEEVVNPRLNHYDLVKFLALGKARAAARKYPKDVIIAADTMVSFRGKIIGKPKNAKDAEKMLKSFSGKAQDVITGVAVLDAQTKQVVTATDKIRVYFKKLSASEISKYIKSGEPFDKAGAYGPQGLGFNLINKIEGDFTNILGLPMVIVFNALEKLGVKI